MTHANYYPKVTDQNEDWLKEIYYPAKINKFNINFNGGKNYKLHKQYNDIINLLLKHPEAHTDNHYNAAKIFAYHCIVHSKNGKGFVVSRDCVFLDRNHKETQGKTPSAYQWLQIQDIAVAQGLGSLFIGGQNQDSNYIPSVFIMSEKLLDILKTKDKTLAPSKPKASPKDSVIVWDSSCKKTRQKLNPRGIREHKNEMAAINTFLSNFNVRDPQGNKIDTTLHTVFIKDFNNYGRCFHAYSGTPEDIRSEITINGEPICELDYSSNHARIAYEELNIFKGEEFKPYNIPEEECVLKGSDRGKRAIYKLGMMMLFNSGNPAKSLHNDLVQKFETIEKRLSKGQTLNKKLLALTEVELPNPTECAKTIASLKAVNSEIKDYFKGCNAGYLQNIDSKIAKAIMNDLLEQGIPFLPYHDSFQVPVSKQEALYKAMFDAWEKVLGTKDCCIVDYKYGQIVEIQETELQQAISDFEEQQDHEFGCTTEEEADLIAESLGYNPSDFDKFNTCPTCHEKLDEFGTCDNHNCENWIPF